MSLKKVTIWYNVCLSLRKHVLLHDSFAALFAIRQQRQLLLPRSLPDGLAPEERRLQQEKSGVDAFEVCMDTKRG